MIFQFRIISDENKDFARELLINGDQTFLDFHNALQENLGYDPHQLASFFITNKAWEKQLQITLIDMMDEEDAENETCTTMDCSRIEEHVNPEEQRMLYVFDFFSERSFFIELTELMKDLENKQLPKVSFEHGDPPAQINLGLDNLSFSEEEDDDDDDSFGFNEEDLGEGFNISDIEEY